MAKRQSHNDNTNKIPGWNVSEPKLVKDPSSFERVNLKPPAFDRLIKQHGVQVHVHRTMYCPNVKSIDGGEHEIDCPMCNGSGFMDVKPLKVFAFIQNQTLEQRHGVEGFADGNTVAITFPIGVELQYFTLIELCDHSEIFFQKVVRSEGTNDVLKYKALRVNVLIDKSGVEYTQGLDFVLNDLGNIVWKEGKGPESGTIYSVHYEARIQFRAVRSLHTNRFEQIRQEGGVVAQVKMPEQWLCTKEFLVRRRGFNGEELLPNAIPGYDEGTPDE